MSKRGARSLVLGFIHVARPTPEAFRAGYLLTTDYGRPIEFHYTSTLRIPRRQQILHGARFEETLHAEILAKPMTDRQTTAPQIILVDSTALLALRARIPAPVVYLRSDSRTEDRSFSAIAHGDHPKDAGVFEKIRGITPTGFDWFEPFERIEAALAEIREPSAALDAA